MPSIIQVVSTTNNVVSSFALPNAVWTNIPTMTLPITPSLNTNPIKILAQVNGYKLSANIILLRILANGVPVGNGVPPGGQVACNSRIFTFLTFVPVFFIDTTGYAGAVTYQLQAYGLGANTFYLNRDDTNTFAGSSTLILQEIG